MSQLPAQTLETWRLKIEAALDASLAPHGESEPGLLQAMQHAVRAGGKRLRPLLVVAACQAAGGRMEDAVPAAVAVELLHSYSLVHDDLPAMDDAQLRRGQPCTHVLFGEAMGILAGDALQTRAFEVLTESALPAERVVRQVAVLARAAGVAGMAGGQMLDLNAEGRTHLREDEVAQIHRLKTGALLAGSLHLGALAGGATSESLMEFVAAGAAVGLAFQIQDDVLDATSSDAALGKTAGQDSARGKATWPAVVGIEESRRRVMALTEEALRHLESLGAAAEPLRELVRRAAHRVS